MPPPSKTTRPSQKSQGSTKRMRRRLPWNQQQKEALLSVPMATLKRRNQSQRWHFSVAIGANRQRRCLSVTIGVDRQRRKLNGLRNKGMRRVANVIWSGYRCGFKSSVIWNGIWNSEGLFATTELNGNSWSVAVEFNRQRLSTTATVVRVVGDLEFNHLQWRAKELKRQGFFFFFYYWNVFCGSWFFLGVLGIVIRLISL